jgi:hypothetical protein
MRMFHFIAYRGLWLSLLNDFYSVWVLGDAREHLRGNYVNPPTQSLNSKHAIP